MNQKKWAGNEDFPGLAELAPQLAAGNILTMDEEFYKKKVQPKFFYLTRDELWKWQVNALNYMDNGYRDQYRPFILEACQSNYEKVREMANAICEKRQLNED